MAHIKFSHRYCKLAIQTECARLLQVFTVDRKELTEDFIKYDTVYFEDNIGREYELPRNRLLILLFYDDDNDYLFTTIRRWTPQKAEWYKSQQGKILDVIFTQSQEKKQKVNKIE